MPAQGQVIALAAALQESGLRNLAHGDRDSLGLFQQRPSQGWGTPIQIRTPTYAATRFYQALLAVPDWQQLPLTAAAQAVQHSAHPTAYAQHESAARQIRGLVAADALGAPSAVQAYLANPDCLFGGGNGLPETAAAALPPGYTLPSTTPPAVRTAITWALAQLGTPYSYGGDCTAPPLRQTRPAMRLLQPRPTGLRPRRHPLPRTTGDQVHAGRKVASLSQIQPGDLVFIPGANGTRARPGHVGLYIGKGLIVQAPRTGATVKLTNLNTWAPQVAALRRIA